MNNEIIRPGETNKLVLHAGFNFFIIGLLVFALYNLIIYMSETSRVRDLVLVGFASIVLVLYIVSLIKILGDITNKKAVVISGNILDKHWFWSWNGHYICFYVTINNKKIPVGIRYFINLHTKDRVTIRMAAGSKIIMSLENHNSDTE